MASVKVYLAGPEVFLRDAVRMGQAKKDLCAAHGLLGLFPFDNEVRPEEGGPAVDELIYRANVAMMREADCAILNLTPFRGPGADGGTAFELGFLTALGKPVFGYTNVSGDYRERVAAAGTVAYDEATASWRDAEDLSVEDFGNADNLMLDRSLAASGHPIVRGSSSPAEAARDLAAFAECVRAVALRLGTRGA